MENETLVTGIESASKKKVEEYIGRFTKGALDTNDLSPERLGAFYPAVREALVCQIPPKYFNNTFTPELLDEMWTQAVPVDPEEAEAQKRIRTLSLHAYKLKWDEIHVDYLPSTEQEPTVVTSKNTPLAESVRLEPDEKNSAVNVSESIVRNEIEERVVARALELSKDKPPAVQELWRGFLADQNNIDTRDKLVKAFFDGTYAELRSADYPIDTAEEATWEYAQNKRDIGVREENEWMYRGVFNVLNSSTETRGSFNVDVTPTLIDKLDALITSDGLKANYKFGKPDTKNSPTERHDSITIYFFEQPNLEVLMKLSDIAGPYVRGNTLLGEKVAEGFTLSEIGSIKSEQIDKLLDLFEGIDPSFTLALKNYATPRNGGALAMSEAQFYAIKRSAADFGYVVNYDNKNGFDLELETLSEDEENAGVREESATYFESSPDFASTALNDETTFLPKIGTTPESIKSSPADKSDSAAVLKHILKKEAAETIHPSRFESKNNVSIHEQAIPEGSQLRRAVDDLSALIMSRNRQDRTSFFENGGLNLLLNGSESLAQALQSNETVGVAKSISDIVEGLQMFGKNTTNSTQDTPQSIDQVGFSLEEVRRSLLALQRVYDRDPSAELVHLKGDIARGIGIIPRQQDLVQRLSSALRSLQNN